jgi:hypothetical protein
LEAVRFIYACAELPGVTTSRDVLQIAKLRGPSQIFRQRQKQIMATAFTLLKIFQKLRAFEEG